MYTSIAFLWQKCHLWRFLEYSYWDHGQTFVNFSWITPTVTSHEKALFLTIVRQVMPRPYPQEGERVWHTLNRFLVLLT